MQINGKSEIVDLERKLLLLCGSISVNSVLPFFSEHFQKVSYHLGSRMIVARRKFLQDILSDDMEADSFNTDLHRFQEGLCLTVLIRQIMTFHGIPLQQWFNENTTIDDWESVFKMYNVYQTFVRDKKWTKRIARSIKSMYKATGIDYKKSR